MHIPLCIPRKKVLTISMYAYIILCVPYLFSQTKRVYFYLNIEVTEELSNITTQMDNCFRLLLSHVADDLFTADDFEPMEGASSDHIGTNNADANVNLGNKLRDHGIYDIKKSITIELGKSKIVFIFHC